MGFHEGHEELARWNMNYPAPGSSDLALVVDFGLQR